MTELKWFVLLNKKPKIVWEALTQPDELKKWLCDEVQVDFRPGGHYRITSSTLFRGQTEKVSVQEVAQFEKISFDWQIAGVSTRVEWRLEPQLDMTRLVIHHQIDEGLEKITTKDETKGCEMLQHYWSLCTALLKSYLDVGHAPDRNRLKDEPSDQVIHQVEVPVSAEKAFSAFVVGKEIDAWMGTGAKVDLKVGGRYSFGWKAEEEGRYGPEKILDYDPGREVACSWDADGIPSVVRFKVESAKGGASALITLTHSGFLGHPDKFKNYNEGWFDALITLAVYLSQGQNMHQWNGMAT